ncbi:MAG: photosynthetic complex assembly protein PuhC [Pseudomonadota bacterium]
MANPQYRAAIPRPILIGAGIMMVTAMAVAFVSKRLPEGTDRPVWAPGPIAVEAGAESRHLRIEHEPDGSMLVKDAVDGSELAAFAPGKEGFARMVLRSMSSERRLMNADHTTAFHLQRTPSGGLMLGDPATGRQIHLASFGTSSLGTFERLMPAEEQAR